MESDMEEETFSDIDKAKHGGSDSEDSDNRSYDEEPEDNDDKYAEDDDEEKDDASDQSDEYKKESDHGEDDDGDGGYTLDRLHDSVHESLRKRREEEGEVVETQNPELADPAEKLGDDFEDSPWVPPSIELAWEHRLQRLYHGGTTKMSQIDVSRASDLGLAVPMYFSFIKVMSYALFLMSCCSVPAIAFSYFGHKIPEESRDFVGMYRTTIGNIGHSQLSSSYAENSKCSVADSEGQVCTDIMGVEFTLANVATILCTCEVLQVLIFLAATRWLNKRCVGLREKSDSRSCTISDYSVMVENIPKTATSQEITKFFSDLYPLDRPDWQGRPELDGAQPLQHCDNTGKPYYAGSWVAETVIYQTISKLISAFKAKQSILKNLQRARAKMKMYAPDTSHAYGPNPWRHARAEKDMLHYGQQLDELTLKTLRQAKQKMSMHRKAKAAGGGKPSVTNGLINADSHAAFVTFNYSESMARCIEDYRLYESFPYSLFTPSCLKFQGHKLTISRGPEPDEILWENVEVASWRKLLHRMLTALVAALLLLLGFVVILQASLKKEEFNNNVPDLQICQTELPAVFAGTYSIPGGTEFIRPDTARNSQGLGRAEYDTYCRLVVPNSFYAVYSATGKFDSAEDLLASYDEAACQSPMFSNGVTSDCPLFNASSFCPCISHDTADTCKTASCSISSRSADCAEFSSSTVAGCFCYESLLSLFSGSALDLLAKVSESNDVCSTFFLNYSLAVSLALLASLCTVIINMGLRVSMKVLGKQECHNTIDEEQCAICIKTFFTIYINSAFVALLAFGSLQNKPAYADQAHVMQGEYSDFDAGWYAQVGSLLLVTFVLQALGPLNFKFFKVHMYTPCRMRCAHPKISSQSSHKFAMQADVDALELGGVFDTTQHTAQLLALLFFAMTYAGGLPLLTPLLALTFVIYYRGDKALLCKHYEKPPKIGDAIMTFVLDVLPWAAIVRLCASCWMYSNEFVFPESYFTLEAVPPVLDIDWHAYSEKYNSFLQRHEGEDLMFGVNSGHRLMRANVFPLFVVLLLLLLVQCGGTIVRNSPLQIMYHFFRILGQLVWRCACSQRQHKKKSVKGLQLMALKDPLRAEMAPFTGEYFHFARSEYIKQGGCCKTLRSLVTDELTDEEIAAGWRMTYIGEHKVKMITWESNSRVNGVFRKKGSTQRTYEVIGQYGCWSYELHRIPQYRTIMTAIQQGMESILEDLEHEQGEKQAGEKKRGAEAGDGEDLEGWTDEELGGGGGADKKKDAPYASANQRMSVVDKYNQRRVDKQEAAVKEENKRRKLWTKTDQKKSSKVFVDGDVYGEPDDDVSSGDSDGDDGLAGLV